MLVAWILSLRLVNQDPDSPLLLSAAMAYVFWGIGWGLSRVADVVYYLL